MPAIYEWGNESVFTITNPFSGSFIVNQQTDDGLFLFDRDKCDFKIEVRARNDYVPQGDGGILRRRFLSQVTMPLTIQLWDSVGKPACGQSRDAMIQLATGVFRSLLNAGDNEGRIAWTLPWGGKVRMVDDVRCLAYPQLKLDGNLSIVTASLDSQYPYAQDLDQNATVLLDGVPTDTDNTGSADYLPVFLINRVGTTNGTAVSTFTLQNLTTGLQVVYDSGLPGAFAIPSGHYGELNVFGNTFYEDGDGADLLPGIDQENTEVPDVITGDQTWVLSGCDGTMLWAPAYG